MIMRFIATRINLEAVDIGSKSSTWQVDRWTLFAFFSRNCAAAAAVKSRTKNQLRFLRQQQLPLLLMTGLYIIRCHCRHEGLKTDRQTDGQTAAATEMRDDWSKGGITWTKKSERFNLSSWQLQSKCSTSSWFTALPVKGEKSHSLLLHSVWWW